MISTVRLALLLPVLLLFLPGAAASQAQLRVGGGLALIACDRCGTLAEGVSLHLRVDPDPVAGFGLRWTLDGATRPGGSRSYYSLLGALSLVARDATGVGVHLGAGPGMVASGRRVRAGPGAVFGMEFGRRRLQPFLNGTVIGVDGWNLALTAGLAIRW